MRMMFAAVAMLVAMVFQPVTAHADAAEATAAWFGGADAASRGAAEAELEADRTAAGRFGFGAVRFFAGLERFAQAMNRHGLAPDAGPLSMMAGLPPATPSNGAVEPLDYAKFRGHLERFHSDMAEAAAVLATVDRQADIKIVIDFAEAKLKLGAGAPITLATVAKRMRVFGVGGPSRRPAIALGEDRKEPDSGLVFAFDTADAVWLQGYANVLMAQLDFALAHDFRDLFDTTFHLVFPKAGLPMAEALARRPGQGGGFMNDPSIFDAIAFIHLIDFAVVEPARRKAVRQRLLEVVRLSRENWKLIRAETDADREWLPGPAQKGAHPIAGTETTEKQVAAWLATLDMLEAVLEGQMLVPHPRFPGGGEGVDLKAMLEDDRRFDLVLFLTGSGAVPYLKTGKVVSARDWNAGRRSFGRRGLLGTALWFN